MAGLAALALAYVMSQFYRAFLAVLTPALTADLGATKAQLSTASGAWFVAFALSQFLVGVCLDRYGPKRTASVMLALGGGGGALLFAFATEPLMITVAMALIGIGCAPVLMASVFIFARSFRPAQLAVLTSWMVAVGSAGNVIGASPLAAAAEAFGWREVITALGAITLLIALSIMIFVRDPEKVGTTGGSGLSGYLELLRIRHLWLIIPLMGLHYAPAASIRGLWAGPYLAEVYGLDAIAIGNATLFMALAMVTGSLLYGPLDMFFGTRKWVAVAGSAISLLVIMLLVFYPAPGVTQATILLVLIGLFGSGFGLLMAHGSAFVPSHLTGRGVTLLNFFSIGSIGLAQFATGAIYSASAVPNEPVAAYQALFWFYALALAAALLIYLFSRDAKPKRPLEETAAPGR